MPLRLFGFAKSKEAEFYFLRTVLAITCAVCQTRFYSVIARTFNQRVAIFFVFAMVFSPGMYHAAPAYLPSSFAMYTTMLGFSAFMDWSGGLRTAQGLMWFGIGALLGWPFAGALVLPFVAEEVFLAAVTGQGVECIQRLADGFTRSVVFLALQTSLDTFFYKSITVVPWNIVMYNVFSGGNRGPDIYGVEPWHFYVRNLALNFNIWFFLALAALPLLLVQHTVLYKCASTPVSKQSLLRSVVFVSPFYLWLAIFTAQPHKEERFMYPVYPALALNAAIALHILLANFGSTDARRLVGKIPPQLKLAVVSIPLLVSFNVGVFRTAGKSRPGTCFLRAVPISKPPHNRLGGGGRSIHAVDSC